MELPNSRPRRAAGAITYLCGAFALGIALGRFVSPAWAWPGVAIAAFGIVAACVVRAQRTRALALLCMSAVSVGCAWLLAHERFVDAHDLSAIIDEDSQLVSFEGVALSGPTVQRRTAGSMAKFSYRDPSTAFELEVRAVHGADGMRTPMRGRVWVRIEGMVPPFHAGDSVWVTGYLRAVDPPHNPGEFDRQANARALGQAGVLFVPARELLHVQRREHSAWYESWLARRAALRTRATALLIGDLPGRERPERDAMLAALLLGQRESAFDDVHQAFQRVGIAHMLAISGLHLGVLAAFVLALLRMISGPRRWHCLALIAFVLLYLVIVEVRMPVLRAGVMIIAASAGICVGRRVRIGGLIAISAVLLLLWRPDQLFTAGFQLSFGVVMALALLAPEAHRRWFGAQQREASTVGEAALEWLKVAMSASGVAWLVATPIALYHFGIVALLGAPLTVLTLPIVALLLALGFAKIVMAAVLPSAALLLAVPLTISADVLLSIVLTIDELPFIAVHLPFPSKLWAMLAVGWVVAWLSRSYQWWPRSARHACRAAGALLVMWAIWPALPIHPRPPLRIDMLSVGDGSCYVVRSRDATIVYDAGSSTNMNAGDQIVVPAFRQLGVRTVDAVVITHADLDHYSAVLEIIDAFRVREVLITPHFLRSAQATPHGPAAFLLDELNARRLAVREIAAGAQRTFGDARFTWLHPHAEIEYERDNDDSMVVLVEVKTTHAHADADAGADAGTRVLLTGDVQTEAIKSLRAQHCSLRVDVVELPHHGSRNDASAEWMGELQPRVVMQSTGRARWENDSWMAALRTLDRLVTARDGACTVIVQEDGTIETRRWLEGKSRR